jgi:hypothetical protein
MTRLAVILILILCAGSDVRAQEQTPKARLLGILIGQRSTDPLGRDIHWAESRDSVLARFADCRPHPSAVVACVLKDSIPTWSFEIQMIRPDSAEVTVRRYHMLYESCPLRRPLDPPVVSHDVQWHTWVIANNQWVFRRGRGLVC